MHCLLAGFDVNLAKPGCPKITSFALAKYQCTLSWSSSRFKVRISVWPSHRFRLVSQCLIWLCSCRVAFYLPVWICSGVIVIILNSDGLEALPYFFNRRACWFLALVGLIIVLNIKVFSGRTPFRTSYFADSSVACWILFVGNWLADGQFLMMRISGSFHFRLRSPCAGAVGGGLDCPGPIFLSSVLIFAIGNSIILSATGMSFSYYRPISFFTY